MRSAQSDAMRSAQADIVRWRNDIGIGNVLGGLSQQTNVEEDKAPAEH